MRLSPLASRPVDPKSDPVDNLTEDEESIISIHPNPSSGIFKRSVGSNFKGDRIYTDVYTSTGILVKTMFLRNSPQIAVDVSDIPNGMYLIRLNDDSKDFRVVKLVKR